MKAPPGEYSYDVQPDAAHFVGMPEGHGLFYYSVVCYSPDGRIYRCGDIHLEPDQAFDIAAYLGRSAPPDLEHWTQIQMPHEMAPSPGFH